MAVLAAFFTQEATEPSHMLFGLFLSRLWSWLSQDGARNSARADGGCGAGERAGRSSQRHSAAARSPDEDPGKPQLLRGENRRARLLGGRAQPW